jgi:hypothetical protein
MDVLGARQQRPRVFFQRVWISAVLIGGCLFLRIAMQDIRMAVIPVW